MHCTYLFEQTFRRKYAYHFRRMSIDGHDMGTHAELVDVRGAATAPLRVTVQAGGPDRVTLDMRVLDLVADRRAEVTAWFETRKQGGASPPKVDSGSLRLLTQGQELSADMDEKSLAELGFKDMQLVLVSQGKQQQQMGPGAAHFRQQQDSTPPFPGRERMPMNLLLLPENFDQLFTLMQALSDLGSPASPSECDPTGRCFTPHPKAQILSRRVWDILMLLPTNPHIKRRLQNISQVTDEELMSLLSPASPQKLMYTFYIVDWLGRPARLRRHSGLHKEPMLPPLSQQFQSDQEGGQSQGDEQQNQQQNWTQRFIHAGGLKHLFEIFASGRLQNDREKGSVWCEWKQDCLSALLKLLVQFGVDPQDDEAFVVEQLMEASAVAAAGGGGMSGGKKRSKRYQQRHSSGDGRQQHYLLNRPPPPLAPLFHDGRLLVPRLSPTMLRMMEADRVVPRLASVLMDASHTKQSQDNAFYRTGVFGRAQVVRFAMSLLVAWLFSAEEEAEDALFASNGLPAWLKGLLLDDPDPSVRREVCTGLYKMCMGSTSSGRSGATCTAPLLSVLLEFLDEALRMAPQSALRRDGAGHGGNVLMHLPSHVVTADDGKEPFGPACRDYFFILCR